MCIRKIFVYREYTKRKITKSKTIVHRPKGKNNGEKLDNGKIGKGKTEQLIAKGQRVSWALEQWDVD